MALSDADIFDTGGRNLGTRNLGDASTEEDTEDAIDRQVFDQQPKEITALSLLGEALWEPVKESWELLEKGRAYDRVKPFTTFEKSLAQFPRAMGVYGVGKELGLEVFSGRSALTPGQRKAFLELDIYEQSISILLSTVETMVGVFAGPIVKGLVFVEKQLAHKPLKWIGRKVAKKIRKVPTDPETIKPFLKPFDYNKSAMDNLKAKGLDTEESTAILDVMQGKDSIRLRDVFLSKAGQGEPMKGLDPSSAYKSMIEIVPVARTKLRKASTGVEYMIRPEIRNSLNHTRLRTAHHRKTITDEIVGLNIKGLQRTKTLIRRLNRKPGETVQKLANRPNEEWAEGFFNAQIQRYYEPDDVLGRIKIGEASDELVAGFIASAVENPHVARAAAGPRGIWFPRYMAPIRFVMGTGGERTYGARSIVQDRVIDARGNIGHGAVAGILRFGKIMEKEGLIANLKITSSKKIKMAAVEGFKPKVVRQSMKVLKTLDEYAGKMLAVTDEAEQLLLRQKHTGLLDQAINGKVDGKSLKPIQKEAMGKFIKSWQQMADWMYSDQLTWQIPRLFEQAGIRLTPEGSRAVGRMMQEQLPEISRLFLGERLSYPEKLIGAQKILGGFKAKLAGFTDDHPWFEVKGNELNKGLRALEFELTMAKPGSDKGYMSLLESYMPRYSKKRDTNFMNKAYEVLGTRLRRATHTFGRKLDKGEMEVTFEQMFAGRLNSHLRMKYLYPVVDEAAKFGETLPPTWQKTISHFLGRSMGQPTVMDEWAADILTNANSYMQWVPGIKYRQFNTSDIQRYAQRLANITYASGIAFRPFTAMRNLLQPIITVPADLGGLRSYPHVAFGYADLITRPEVRRILKEARVITEYAPDILELPKILPFKTKGWQLPRPAKGGKKYVGIGFTEAFKFGMTAFKAADRTNRWVTGAAALRKWKSRSHLLEKNDNFKTFERRMGLTGRNPDVRDKIMDDLRAAKAAGRNYDEVRNYYLRDVVGDTQYRYGTADSPQFIGWGGVGKTAFTYQSWYMNYGALVTKILRTGTGPMRAQRMLNLAMSAALAGEIMSRAWGVARARKAVAAGPFPGNLPVHPAAEVIVMALANIVKAGNLLSGMPTKGQVKQGKALLETPMPVVGKFVVDIMSTGLAVTPGGVMIRKLAKESQRDDPSLFRGLMEMLPPEKLEEQVTPFQFFGLRE